VFLIFMNTYMHALNIFHLVCILYRGCFNLFCNMCACVCVFCNVWVYVWVLKCVDVCMCGFLNVWMCVCVGF